jgi:dolichyl-phosphate-mannose-protein mannosyltransferase
MTKKQFWIWIAGVFIMSLILRFWGLDRFNTLVFDEVYFAKFGNNYLTGTPFFNAHPPLSQYIIGIGIWIGKRIPFWQTPVNGLTGSILSPWSYRWVNALTGSLIPIVVAGIAYQISSRRRFAVLAGFFTACDGLFLVESRYALNNIYIVIFGLLGQWCLLVAVNQSKGKGKRHLWLILSGIFFGASVGTKWNGLWFLVAVYLLWITAWIINWLQQKSQNLQYLYEQSPTEESITTDFVVKEENQNKKISSKRFWNQTLPSKTLKTPLENLAQINILQMFAYLGVIPVIIYSIIWIPHLRLDKRFDFIEVHKQIWGFHNRLGGNTAEVHPYCAAWNTWPLMIRPMAYYYQTAVNARDPLPVLGPPLPANTAQVIYDVHAMGNPILWWLGLTAIFFIAAMVAWQLLSPSIIQQHLAIPENISTDVWIGLYLVINYLANFLPWVKVTRCVFLYHYMCAVVFLFIAIAWFVDQCFRSSHKELRPIGIVISSLIVIFFIFWMPIYLGLPIPANLYRTWMWVDTWI